MVLIWPEEMGDGKKGGEFKPRSESKVSEKSIENCVKKREKKLAWEWSPTAAARGKRNFERRREGGESSINGC